MTVRQLIAELRGLSQDMPIVIMSSRVYDKEIKLGFNADVGVTICNPAINQLTEDLIVAATVMLKPAAPKYFGEDELVPAEWFEQIEAPRKALRDALEGFGVEIG